MPRGIYARRWNPVVNLGERVPVSWRTRFWRHVDLDGPVVAAALGPCWVWTASTDRKGYGKLQVGTLAEPRYVAAHRLAWEMEEGAPPRGHVLHRCDNPPCVRRSHLFEGGHKENAADKVAKGRQTQGSRHPFAKLTDEQVREIRSLDWTLMSQSKVARRYGVSNVTIHNIIKGKTYRSPS